jgi:hypothetical protein
MHLQVPSLENFKDIFYALGILSIILEQARVLYIGKFPPPPRDISQISLEGEKYEKAKSKRGKM